MKILWIVLATLFMLACNTQPKTGSSQAEETAVSADARWVEATINVNGMTCEGCENAVNAGINGLDGIATVESSHEEKWTRVKYDENLTSIEEITASITETGYEVVEDI